MEDELPPFEEIFPNISGSYTVTSEETAQYNCVAWACGTDKVWFQSDGYPTGWYYWPAGIPRYDSTASWIKLFELMGYSVCKSADYEPGWEKIAIYVSEDDISEHAARQLPSGKWTSKLGDREDICHDTLEALAGEEYGEPKIFLKKHRPDWEGES